MLETLSAREDSGTNLSFKDEGKMKTLLGCKSERITEGATLQEILKEIFLTEEK